jgi:hypothetical protein
VLIITENFFRFFRDARFGRSFNVIHQTNHAHLNFPIAASGTAISADTFSEQTNRLGKRLWAKCFNFVAITLLSLKRRWLEARLAT